MCTSIKQTLHTRIKCAKSVSSDQKVCTDFARSSEVLTQFAVFLYKVCFLSALGGTWTSRNPRRCKRPPPPPGRTGTAHDHPSAGPSPAREGRRPALDPTHDTESRLAMHTICIQFAYNMQTLNIHCVFNMQTLCRLCFCSHGTCFHTQIKPTHPVAMSRVA